MVSKIMEGRPELARRGGCRPTKNLEGRPELARRGGCRLACRVNNNGTGQNLSLQFLGGTTSVSSYNFPDYLGGFGGFCSAFSCLIGTSSRGATSYSGFGAPI